MIIWVNYLLESYSPILSSFLTEVLVEGKEKTFQEFYFNDRQYQVSVTPACASKKDDMIRYNVEDVSARHPNVESESAHVKTRTLQEKELANYLSQSEIDELIDFLDSIHSRFSSHKASECLQPQQFDLDKVIEAYLISVDTIGKEKTHQYFQHASKLYPLISVKNSLVQAAEPHDSEIPPKAQQLLKELEQIDSEMSECRHGLFKRLKGNAEQDLLEKEKLVIEIKDKADECRFQLEALEKECNSLLPKDKTLLEEQMIKREALFNTYTKLSKQSDDVVSKINDEIYNPRCYRRFFPRTPEYFVQEIVMPVDRIHEQFIQLEADFERFLSDEKALLEKHYGAWFSDVECKLKELKRDIAALNEINYATVDVRMPLRIKSWNRLQALYRHEQKAFNDFKTEQASIMYKKQLKLEELAQYIDSNDSKSLKLDRAITKHKASMEAFQLIAAQQQQELSACFECEAVAELADVNLLVGLESLHSVTEPLAKLKEEISQVRTYRNEYSDSNDASTLREERIAIKLKQIANVDTAYRTGVLTAHVKGLPDAPLDQVKDQECPTLFTDLDEKSVEVFNGTFWEKYSQDGILGIITKDGGKHPLTRRRIKVSEIRAITKAG